MTRKKTILLFLIIMVRSTFSQGIQDTVIHIESVTVTGNRIFKKEEAGMKKTSIDSLVIAEKISYMADGIGVNKVRAILNKIPSVQIGADMTDKLEDKNIIVAGIVYLDDQIAKASLEGEALPFNSSASVEMQKIAQLLLAS